MSNGLATTGVDGLEVIIAEAGISSWYNYYRENGLVTSPGGYPGEDFDSLAELTYSRNLLGGDYLHHNAAHQADLDIVKKELDRASGAVSYTHLTLPTIYSVEISVDAETLKKKKIEIRDINEK